MKPGTRLLYVVCVLAALSALNHVYVSVPPDAQKQSKFLRTYDPMPLLHSALGADCGAASSFSASAGLMFLNLGHNVEYERTIEPELCRAYHYSAILTALHGNVVSALGSAGCRVLSDDLSLDHGIRIAYRCGGRSTGLVTAAPSAHEPFSLKLRFQEEWSVRGNTGV